MHQDRSTAVKLAAMAGFFAMALATGCASRNTGPVANNAPDWVNRGSGAFKDSGGSVFYGVGIAQGIRNRALSTESADDRARAEIAKTMNSYIEVLNKDYQASTTAGDMTKSSEEQHVSQVLKNFAKFTLHGAIIIDHWKDPSDGTMFSLCKLDMGAMKASLEDAKELDSKVRDYVRANAEKAFDEMSAESAKH